MKKTILIALAFALCGTIVAQNDTSGFHRHEISIGYGFHPVSGDYFSMDGYSHFNYWIDNVGAIYGTYTFYFNKVVGVGGTYCFDYREIDYTHHSPTTNNNHLVCNLNESCHSLMGHVKLNCINKRYFTLYCKADAGLCFWGYQLEEFQPDLYGVELPDQHCCFAWQTAAGIELAYERIAGFLQCGIGMEGNYSLGIRYKF